MARTKTPAQPRPEITSDLPSSPVKKVPKPQNRDQSPTRSNPKTLIIVTARDASNSLQICLDPKEIPDEVEELVREFRGNPPFDSCMHIEQAVFEPDDDEDGPGKIDEEDKEILQRFLKSIGFTPNDYKYNKNIQEYETVKKAAEPQFCDTLQNKPFSTDVNVNRVWNFISDTRDPLVVLESEAKIVGEWLCDDAELMSGENETKEEWVNLFGSKLPGITKKLLHENPKEMMEALGDYLCYHMPPKEKAEWLKKYGKHGIDLTDMTN